MKRLNIVVNGVSYDVSVQELKEGQTIAPTAPTAPAAPVAAPVAAAPVAAGEGEKVTAPMPGNIWKVMVKEGQNVKKGDVLVILEAMKMENEINASADGVVLQLEVVEGQSVDTDQLIAVIG